MSTPSFDDRPPQLDRVSPYDERHLASYIRLLDAEAEGADWRQAVAVLFFFYTSCQSAHALSTKQ